MTVEVQSIAPIAFEGGRSDRGVPVQWKKNGAVAVWIAVPRDLPKTIDIPAAGKVKGFVLFRPDPYRTAWRAFAFSLTDVRKPGRELGIPAIWSSSLQRAQALPATFLAMTAQRVAIVTEHPCKDLLATISVHSEGDLTPLGIASVQVPPSKPSCASESAFHH